jgi:hypothetical protein
MKIETLAYAAGLFDGEGYVDIYKASTSKASKSPSFMLRVIISQKDGIIMNWLQDNFGGYVQLEKRSNSYIYRWDTRSQKAEKFLSSILPFVKIKTEQVQVALAFERKKSTYLNTLKGNQGFRQITSEEIEWRYKIRDHLKKLKKDYKPYIKNGVQVQRLNE